MSPLDNAVVGALRDIYATIPDLHCKGLCSNSCRTRIDMSAAEKERIERVTGSTLPEHMFHVEGLVCPLLADDHRCTVYGVRPTVCRLWGAAESMPCPHGCLPDNGRLFTDDEAMELMLQTLEAGGARSGDTGRARLLLQQMPGMKPLIARVLRGDRAARDEMATLVRQRFPDGVPTEKP